MAKKANKLLSKIQQVGTIESHILSDSEFLNRDIIKTDIPIINLAGSGDLNGGFTSGITIVAGASKSFKTLLALYCLKAYLDKYDDAIGLIYDSEFGITPEYLKIHNIDTDRVLHIPTMDLEKMKFDLPKRLEEIERGDHVFIMVDSLGTLGSKKEINDALEEKSVGDMTRAKEIRSILRIVSPHIFTKDIPCLLINHVYQEIGPMFPRTIVSGGTAVYYLANQIFIITRAQDKNKDGNIEGWYFTINIEKSRFVREKSKFELHVTYEDGMNRHSGILDLAVELGYAEKTKVGKRIAYVIPGYQDPVFEKDLGQYLETLLTNKEFLNKISNKYKLNHDKENNTDDHQQSDTQ